MTKVVIQPGLLRHHRGPAVGRSVVVETTAGEALRDLCDEARAPVPFSCRSGRCGTCFVEVLEGAEHLSAVGDDEELVLDTLGVTMADGEARPDHRLACQAVIEAPTGVVRLRVAELRRP